MASIFLIVKSGPEWCNPVEAWTTKQHAADRVAQLEAERKASSDVFDRLSGYEVRKIELKEHP